MKDDGMIVFIVILYKKSRMIANVLMLMNLIKKNTDLICSLFCFCMMLFYVFFMSEFNLSSKFCFIFLILNIFLCIVFSTIQIF